MHFKNITLIFCFILLESVFMDSPAFPNETQSYATKCVNRLESAINSFKEWGGGRSKKKSSIMNKYESYIHEASQKTGFDPALIKAVIKCESNWDEMAISDKSACGLMQILPETAKSLGMNDIFDPYENILHGSLYLKELYLSCNNNLEHALASYNAGLGAVKQHNGVPPYPETVNYVKKVLHYYNIYKKLK